MLDAVIPGVVSVFGAIAVAVLTILFGRRSSNADVELKQANAEQIRVGTAVTAAAAIRELSAANAELVDRQSETQHQLNEVLEANEMHEAWDRLMVETLRKMRDALAAAGIVVDVGHLPDPPPLAKRTMHREVP